MSGKVYIVGAGPGDPGLITVRALERLRSADVVVYDRLVNPSLLDEAPPAAERIYAGKKPGDHAACQEETSTLLAFHASMGKTVVRLKGGDPFVFGRGGEEADFLAQRGIAFEIVPGVTSALAAPAFAGIPVTLRGVSNSFAVATGHVCTGTALDYAALYRSAGTLVILMGVENFPGIRRQLLEDGVDPATPVAFIEQATLESQRSLVCNLGKSEIEWRDIRPPAVIVIGSVVSFSSGIRWFEAARANVCS